MNKFEALQQIFTILPHKIRIPIRDKVSDAGNAAKLLPEDLECELQVIFEGSEKHFYVGYITDEGASVDIGDATQLGYQLDTFDPADLQMEFTQSLAGVDGDGRPFDRFSQEQLDSMKQAVDKIDLIFSSLPKMIWHTPDGELKEQLGAWKYDGGWSLTKNDGVPCLLSAYISLDRKGADFHMSYRPAPTKTEDVEAYLKQPFDFIVMFEGSAWSEAVLQQEFAARFGLTLWEAR